MFVTYYQYFTLAATIYHRVSSFVGVTRRPGIQPQPWDVWESNGSRFVFLSENAVVQ